MPKKMMPSESRIFEGKFKNFFISWKSHVSFFRYPNFDICNHSINFKNCDVMMSNGTLRRVHF